MVNGLKFATGANVVNKFATVPAPVPVFVKPVMSKLKYKSACLSTYCLTAFSVTNNEFDAELNTPFASPPSDASVDTPVTVIDESANPKFVTSSVATLTTPVPEPSNTRSSFDLAALISLLSTIIPSLITTDPVPAAPSCKLSFELVALNSF